MRRWSAGARAEGGLARIAAALGYADQAHLTRESRELSNLSPLELERLWRLDPGRRATVGALGSPETP